MRKRNETIEVPIRDEDIGDTWVNVAFLSKDRLYRRATREGAGGVASTAGDLTARQAVSATHAREVPPDGRGCRRRPVRGQFSLSVVDEAVYG